MKLGSDNVAALFVGAARAYSVRRGTDLVYGFLPETVRLLEAFTAPAARERQDLIDATIRALVEAGLWEKFDLLYLLAAHDEQAARLNWKAPPAATLTAVNTPAFTADEGFTGDGAASYLDAGVAWNALTAYALDSSHIGAWILNDVAASNVVSVVGQVSGGTRCRLIPRTTSGGIRAYLNTATQTDFGSSIGTTAGHAAVVRRASNEVEAYKNGASIGTGTTASDEISDRNVTILRHLTNYGAYQVAAMHAGAALSDTEAADLYAILEDYLTGVGAV